jgi:NADP-dependent 3-hydroxy acid dehydrogenase YdfG
MKDMRPRVINLKPGYVDTDSVRDKMVPKLDPMVIADTFIWILKQPPMVHISSVSLAHMQFG